MPHMKTTGNSRPFAECRVIICTQSSQASAWPSPDSSTACDRKDCSGGSSSIPPSGSKPLAAFGLLALVVIEETARLEHLIHLLKERQVLDLARQTLDERHEALHGARGLRPEPVSRAHRRSFPQRAAGGLRLFANNVQALRANAAGRQVYHALEGGVVPAVRDEPQVRKRILDF